jgi:hypothetical protein
MSKHLAGRWLSLAERLSHLEPPFRAKNIAICLASAYRQGWNGDVATILLRTIAAEAERTGSWEVPVDLQERIAAHLREQDRRKS